MPGSFDTEESARFPRRGRVEPTHTAELLGWLGSARFSGTARFVQGEREKRLRFDRGLPTEVESTDVGELLGQRLVRKGLVDGDVLDAVLGGPAEGRRLGARLVEAGALDDPTLNEQLESQLVDRLVELFTWTEGQYELVEEPARDGPRPPVVLEELVHRGLTRADADPSSRLHARATAPLDFTEPDAGAAIAAQLDPEPAGLLAACVPVTVPRFLGAPTAEVAARRARLMLTLLACGHLVPSRRRPSSQGGEARPVPRDERWARAALGLGRRGLDEAAVQAAFAAAAERWTEPGGEERWLELEDARALLLHPDARQRPRAYPRGRGAAEALDRYDEGLAALLEGRIRDARAAFADAAALDPEVPEYADCVRALDPGDAAPVTLEGRRVRARLEARRVEGGAARAVWGALLDLEPDDPEAMAGRGASPPSLWRRIRRGS